MTLLDANILLYAYNLNAPEHQSARSWMERALASGDLVGLTWLTLWAFLRISTNPRLFPHPLQIQEAFNIVSKLLAHSSVRMIHPGARHAGILESLVLENQAGGPLLTDAALAALAIEHGAILASTDHDFSRFTNLRWLNPLKAKAN